MVDMDNYKKHGLSFVKLDIVPKNDSNDVANGEITIKMETTS